MKVRYSSNNSGGGWWLSDDDWKNLETAGWEVRWIEFESLSSFRQAGAKRWLGALATEATRTGLTYDEAIAEFEKITGQYAHEEGCDCCGRPHEFYEED